MATRSEYIRRNYALNQTPGGWEAVKIQGDGLRSAVTRSTKAEAIAYARRSWGHFNHDDEAEVFVSIFS